MHPDERKIVVFDLDGTLADISHRLHYIKGEIKDWDGFHGESHNDELKKDIAKLFHVLMSCYDLKIIIVTGRMEKYRAQTETWLSYHGLDAEELHMRPNGNFDTDFKIKQAILDGLGAHNILLTVDDRAQVVSMWRRNGVTCLQCQDGDY